MNTLSIRSYAAVLLLTAIAGCSASTDAGDEVTSSAAALSHRAPDVPAAIALPAGNRLAFYLDAEGQQIYGCQATATGYGWVLVAPDADLFKPNGRFAGTHYAGPTWESIDGSTVVGSRIASYVDDPTAIPWLLLGAASHTGEGRMSNVSYIHRLYTSGGLAPKTGCDADHVGAQSAIDYTATYYFYVPSTCEH